MWEEKIKRWKKGGQEEMGEGGETLSVRMFKPVDTFVRVYWRLFEPNGGYA